MSKAAMNLQDSFLNQVRRENTEVTVLLVNGKSLRGVVKGFDNFTLILNSRSGQHLIYKHAIAQVMNQRGGSKGDETMDAADEPESKPAAAPAPAGGEQPRQRKEVFNRLDLSNLKAQATES